MKGRNRILGKSNFLRSAIILAAAGFGGFYGVAAFSSPSQTSPAGLQPADLKALLKKTAGYCQKLEGMALNFVCREEIKETIDPTLDAPQPIYQPIYRDTKGYDLMPLTFSSRGNIKTSYVYDYQCIRSGGEIIERRILLKENGKAKNEPDAKLKTSVVVFGTALMGPVGLFGERFQSGYEFVVSGQDRVGKTKVLIIDAVPRPDAPETRNLYGKAWVDPATGDILKIEWSENRVGRFDIFEKRGERYQRTPRLVIRSEFKAEKNGIRFPSRLSVEEAYLDKRGRAKVRSTTEVTYKDFKFFTVEVEVRE
jgi:hypothetical protein